MSSTDPLDADAVAAARALMDGFARDTGLGSSAPPRRYLWTDAYAVCNDLGLFAATGERAFLERALALVEQVHRVLGRHRPDDPREGWISGLSEEEGARHPTLGGLRIGKPLPERAPDAPFDEALEWERDGQYYHYLTRWMHALCRVWRVTGDARHHRHAVELARAAQRGFTAAGPGGPRLVWKASVDLSRPLVPSSGQHDPLDGLLTLGALRATAPPGEPDALADEVAALAEMCRGRSFASADPLGVGGLLVDALRCAQLARLDVPEPQRPLDALLVDAARSLAALDGFAFLGAPAARRLAFRELGLAIGLRALARLAEADARAARLARAVPGADAIVAAWRDPAAQAARTWTEHRDISAVMLATALVPDGALDL